MLNQFKKSQDDYFARSCEKRYKWQTQNLFIALAERKLLSCLTIVPGTKVLELGCGTGSNLFNLRAIYKAFEFTGVDINAEEINLAKNIFPNDNFMVGDATNVMLSDESFDLVFCRDVIHHIEPSQQLKFIQEMARLTRVGGQLVVIESNGLNFVIRVFASLVKAERQMLKSTPERITMLIKQVEELDTKNLKPVFTEPWNFFRFILHYSFGIPGLAGIRLLRQTLTRVIEFAAKATPSRKWAYMIFTATKVRR